MIKYGEEEKYNEKGVLVRDTSTYARWYNMFKNPAKIPSARFSFDNKRTNNLIKRCINNKNVALLNIKHEWDFIRYICQRELKNQTHT